MNKVFLLSFFTLGLIFVTIPVMADMLVLDIDPPNTNPTYWIGDDVNVIFTIPNQGQLVNSNEATEEAWLEGLLGLAYNSPLVGNPQRILAGQGGIGLDEKQLFNYNPGFAWDFVVIKYDNNWIAYLDTNNDNLPDD